MFESEEDQKEKQIRCKKSFRDTGKVKVRRKKKDEETTSRREANEEAKQLNNKANQSVNQQSKEV